MTHQVEVGVFGGEGDDGDTMLMIATVHEYGTEITVTDKMAGYLAARSTELGLTPETGGLFLKPGSTIRIPERSFIRSAFDSHQKEVGEAASRRLGRILRGQDDAEGLLNWIGQQMQGFVIRHIFRATFTPNHPFTVASKSTSAGAGDRPLTDKGHLGSASTIKWRVVQR